MPSYKEQFNLNIFDHSSVGYCVLELVLDDKGQPVDWIYRYCNQAFADIKDYRLEAMIDRSFLDLFPKIDEKWLYACYGAAYENRSSEMVIRKGKKYHMTITPIGKSGFCSGLIQAWDKDRNPDDEIQDPLSDEEFIIRKLFPEYVSLLIPENLRFSVLLKIQMPENWRTGKTKHLPILMIMRKNMRIPLF